MVEYTIITAFLLLCAFLLTRAIATKGIDLRATFGIHRGGNIVVPPMTD